MGITEITLYNLLRKKMGEQETYELVQFIHSEIKTELDAKTNVLLTKDDKLDLIEQAKAGKIDLTERIKTVQIDLIERINTVQVDLIERINGVQADLIERINGVQADLIKRISTVQSDLIDRMNKNKTETLVWIVGTGVLQFLMILLSKKL